MTPTLDLKLLQARALAVWRRIPLWLGSAPADNSAAADEAPLRSGLLTAEQMQHHGKALAGAHRLSREPCAERLLPRLADNETAIKDVCRGLALAVAAGRPIAPAAEWLLDNFYLIDEQIRTAIAHFPKGYSRMLPRLAGGESRHLPRVYDIALETVSHGDGRVDPDSLHRFVTAYQSVCPLDLGELWAIPIMLRLSLIENLRRVAVRVAHAKADRDLADVWADRMLDTAEHDPKGLIGVIADMARSLPPLNTPFVSEFERRLQGQSSALALALTWIEQSLSESQHTIKQMVQSEAQQQAADQVSVANSIASLRFLSTMDWRTFVEALSAVEHILKGDPAATYARMDFATRDRYRHVIEQIARRSRFSETEVAKQAIALAVAAGFGAPEREWHVGYYLIDRGLPMLHRVSRFRHSWRDLRARLTRRYPLTAYLGTVGVLTAVFSATVVWQAQQQGVAGAVLLAVGLLVLFSASQLAVALTNWLAMLSLAPDRLPKMDLADGIPASLRTLVAIPCMVGDAGSVESLIEGLEVRFLANRDPCLHFALLSDFEDASHEHGPQDAAVLTLLQTRLTELNRQYASDGPPTFYLFHRPRHWNSQEQAWMGRERKRGKLADLNAALLGGGSQNFSVILGDLERLRPVRYVITLDTDTQLPKDSARQLIGTLAHPLNHAVLDAQGHRVVAGYGILQPRVAISLLAANRSRYAQLSSGEPGIDPYTRAVSDVYQDLFGEGSFIGKGIYDLAAFEQVMGGRMPLNQILSHDLLEGCYARSGLLSDVQLFEDHPAQYLEDVARRRRWIRGDWQLLGWLLPWVASAQGPRRRNPVSLLSRWKLLDNLRRSLVPAALCALLLVSWTLLPPTWIWTVAVLAVMLIPALCASLVLLIRKPKAMPVTRHVGDAIEAAGRHLAPAGLALACLPFEAYFSLASIGRTLFRLVFSRRRLLEWRVSGRGSGSAAARADLRASYRAMWIGPALAIVLGPWLTLIRPEVLWQAAPLLLLWLAAPAMSAWLGRPRARRVQTLAPDQTLFLRRLARRTWAFFEVLMGPDDHWLPPDNIQEHPSAAIAHRTSPTNMGLALLANLAAHDFGYQSAGQLLVRTDLTLASMASLERFSSHFYNWYDTQTLQPLNPLYVSTVDSGNLAGHLLTLRAGLLQLASGPLIPARWHDGLSDTTAVLIEVLAGTPAPAVTAFEQALRQFPAPLGLPLPALHAAFAVLCSRSADIVSDLRDDGDPEVTRWARALSDQCADLRAELEHLAPWAGRSPAPAGTDEFAEIDALTSLAALPMVATRTHAAIERRLSGPLAQQSEPASADGLRDLQHLLNEGRQHAELRIAQAAALATRAHALVCNDYTFLYDKTSRLLAVGYNVDDGRADTSHYDLLASEARLCSFVAIAQGSVPQESWFALGRLLAATGREPILLSWSGSMFEYLMPLLVMPTFENTLLDRTYSAAVNRQIAYGRQRGVPWGISESGHNTVDVHLNYQYRAFGVPGLGLKRGLGDDLVIAPYASALALMVAPLDACRNLQRLAVAQLAGRFGLFEAIDYTPARLPRGKDSAVVRSFMAHHQGMSLLSIAYHLLDQPMQRRFQSEPMFQAVMVLLQERVPKVASFHHSKADLALDLSPPRVASTPIRVLASADTPLPEVQLLSNGRYHVMITHAGGGYSRWKDLAVTRWREDPTRDHAGLFCYLSDPASGVFWSTAHQPTLAIAGQYEAIFSEGRVEFRRRDHGLETTTEIAVSPEDDIELRRVRISNPSRSRRTIEFTSYAEVVLAPAAADDLHPAFSKLFVQTEVLADRHAILCARRPRSIGERVPSMFHLVTVHGAAVEAVSFETDRARFIGRGQTLQSPQAMRQPGPLSGTQGAVLDPIVAIRYRITLEAQHAATIDLVMGVGDTRDAALGLVEKYQDRQLADRVFELAWTHSQVLLRQINATEADAQLYTRLANSVIYANSSLRADAATRLRNRRGQSGLWGYAISGDLPIVLLKIADPASIELVRQLVQAHAHWRLKGLAVDLVIWNEDRGGYRQALQEQILGLISAGLEAHVIDRPGGVFVRSAEHISDEDRGLFEAVARAILVDTRGTLAEQLARRDVRDRRVARAERHGRRSLLERRVVRLVPTRNDAPVTMPPAQAPDAGLTQFNGLGGFSADGSEYVMTLADGQTTPAPWVNVLANPHFGTVVSESGSAYTWSENAHEFRLTPWGNDPVSDPSGEVIYLRDEESGQFWTPTPLPRRASTPYRVRHGFGYSVFSHVEAGIECELTVYVALDAPVKYSVLKVSNRSGRTRHLSVTGYIEWVLGDLRAKSAMHLAVEADARQGVVYARNPFNSEFGQRTAFFAISDRAGHVAGSWCVDRTEFIGRNGTLAAPAALLQSRLSTSIGMSSDPCAALQMPFELAAGEDQEIIFRLGVGADRQAAAEAVALTRPTGVAHEVLDAVRRYWTHTLGALQVRTPDPAIDSLVNGWLLYQTLACRVWARSGYYQSGGAFGFRDQLQDVMALIHAKPQIAREQLLLSASRQFREGDVQHWWHPPAGRGVRTHFSDDFLWLPLAVCRYVQWTGDTGVLNGSIPYLDGRAVNADDDSYYDLPLRSAEAGSLYQHCVKAIERGLRFGVHGLPLMGTGDWNDGMNRVGKAGRGESVWLGFFLCEVLQQFSRLASRHGDAAFAEQCHRQREQLAVQLEAHGWDGQWYRRAYFDDGTPLGSMLNSECRIDSIAQSWSVLSGVGDPGRARMAMNALDEHLVRRDRGLVQLLDPPFDKSTLDPGYIRGYVPGVRENGGQYTHAAIWAAMAFAAQGDAVRAWELTSMINPVNHANTPQAVAIYKVEPYVIAADVYASNPHAGRGGWTWYTGSAGWMYRLIVESLLGLRCEGARLFFQPCLPADWAGFSMRYRYRDTEYQIDVEQQAAAAHDQGLLPALTLDGVLCGDAVVHLVDDRLTHRVLLRVAASPPASTAIPVLTLP